MYWALFCVVIGVLALLGGAESLVRGASQLALRWGISPLIVGLTVVSFGTSMPEVMASLFAVFQGASGDIALGNVIGSNIANIGLICGVTALIRPIPVCDDTRLREWPIMMAATIFLTALLYLGPIGRLDGIVLLACLFAYVFYQYNLAQDQRGENGNSQPLDPVWKECLFVIAGVAGLALGGYWLVDGAIALAEILGVSERVIGILVVAIGTSSPELATSLVASLRGHHSIAIGNVIGSNIFNILFVLGIVGALKPFDFSPVLLTEDMPVLFYFSLVLGAFGYFFKEMRKGSGALLLLSYTAYMSWLVYSG